MMISMYSLSLYIIVYFTGFGLVYRNLAIKRTGNTTLRVQAPFVGVTHVCMNMNFLHTKKTSVRGLKKFIKAPDDSCYRWH